ncbi:MAG: IucA/IucC family protein, partial [Micromonosporaceae bacterium]
MSDLATLAPPATTTPAELAQRAATDALLRCWTREAGIAVPDAPATVSIPLAASGLTVVAEVRHRSAVGWHRFGTPYLPTVPDRPVDAVTLTSLFARESGGDPAAIADLVERSAESQRRIATFLADRAARPDAEPDGFLEAEQGLLLGHLLHPAPKSRDGISDADAAAYSPELRGSFPLHWFAADPSI